MKPERLTRQERAEYIQAMIASPVLNLGCGCFSYLNRQEQVKTVQCQQHARKQEQQTARRTDYVLTTYRGNQRQRKDEHRTMSDRAAARKNKKRDDGWKWEPVRAYDCCDIAKELTDLVAAAHRMGDVVAVDLLNQKREEHYHPPVTRMAR